MKLLLNSLPLAAAVLALNACSSEPSDWRPDKKVSLDMVAPGTRISDNFDQKTVYAPNQAKGAAITKPINSGAAGVDRRPAPSAEASMSANSEQSMRSKSKTDQAEIKAKPGQEDTSRRGNMIQR
ncbi:hypothetical protein [uncultured Hymenobacter sp.]|uniref:hypothetical protein n=1 Tax=uncultured Hymenobacter sp. TaxID=170016 RepID=UPI0035CB6AF2